MENLRKVCFVYICLRHIYIYENVFCSFLHFVRDKIIIISSVVNLASPPIWPLMLAFSYISRHFPPLLCTYLEIFVCIPLFYPHKTYCRREVRDENTVCQPVENSLQTKLCIRKPFFLREKCLRIFLFVCVYICIHQFCHHSAFNRIREAHCYFDQSPLSIFISIYTV